MDVMRFVLNTITKLTLAATGLVVALVVFLLEKLTGHVRNRAHQSAPQQVPQPLPAKVFHSQPQPAANAPPAVHVHVHIDQAQVQPAPMPAPPPQPTAYAPNQSPLSVLNRPDHGIWEMRGDLHFFTHGRAMMWAAFDLGIKAVREHSLEGDVDTWCAYRDRLEKEIWERGFDAERNTFTIQFVAADFQMPHPTRTRRPSSTKPSPATTPPTPASGPWMN